MPCVPGSSAKAKPCLVVTSRSPRPHRRAEPAERDLDGRPGPVSETATLRAMARRLDGSEQLLIELKGVDRSYPLVGGLTLGDGANVAAAVRGRRSRRCILLERLGLKIGDRMQLGNATVEIRAIVEAEPDKISDRLTFGPRVFVSLATLEHGPRGAGKPRALAVRPEAARRQGR